MLSLFFFADGRVKDIYTKVNFMRGLFYGKMKFVKKVVQAFLFDVIRIVDKKLKVL